MNRFFLAPYYEDERATAYAINYQGYTAREHDLRGNNPPAVVFYANAKHRDGDLVHFAKRWPNVKFVSGEITGGQVAKSTDPVSFSVSEKGVLPA